jgi:hypothetical protein
MVPGTIFLGVRAMKPTCRLRKTATRLLVTCWSCGPLGGCSDTVAPPGPTITELLILPESATLSGIGTTLHLTTSAIDTDGDTIPSVAATWSSLNPNIIGIDPVSGVVTTVASGQVVVAAEAEGQVAYAVLTVSVPDMAPVTSWTRSELGFPATDIWGASSDDVFVVGGSGSGADIAHFDGSSWSRMDATGGILWSVWGISGNEVFAVGDGGTVLRYDGASWNPMDFPGGGLTGVWAAAPDAVFGTSNGGGAWRYDGRAWNQTEVGGGWWVWGTSEHDVHYGGISVSRGVWGSSPSDIFAVGRSGMIWHYDGASWTEMDSGTDKFLFGVWGTSPSDVYAVGESGTILHYDGSSWSPMESGTDRELWQIWGISSGDVFVVSRYGFVLRGTRGDL